MGCRQLQIQDFFEVQNFEPRKNIQRRKPHIQSAEEKFEYSDQRYTYDELGRLKTVSVHKRDGVDLTTPEETTYSYNLNGIRVRVRHCHYS